MDKESLIKIRDEILRTLFELKEVDEKDRLEVELMIVQYLDPKNYEENRKVLQKNYYENQRWKKYKEN